MAGGILIVLHILQAATVQSGDATTFDLRKYKANDGCGAGGGGITVCGRRDPDRYRHKELDGEKFEQSPLLAETGLFGNVRGDVHVEQQAMPDGTTSQRVMIRLKTPF